MHYTRHNISSIQLTYLNAQKIQDTYFIDMDVGQNGSGSVVHVIQNRGAKPCLVLFPCLA